MEDLLKYIITGITGHDTFKVESEEDSDGRVQLTVIANKEDMGLIIGKGGNTIKSIQNILRIRGTIDKKYVHLTVREEGV